jgi:glycosyltransferase involved in cell wall biosynthesis
MDVAVHASIVPEPFGQVVVEAMAAGLPVVAVDGGGPAEIVTHELDGLLYPAGDVDVLAARLRRLAADAPLRARLGQAARRRAEEFTSDSVVERLMGVYSQITEGRIPAQNAP